MSFTLMRRLRAAQNLPETGRAIVVEFKHLYPVYALIRLMTQSQLLSSAPLAHSPAMPIAI